MVFSSRVPLSPKVISHFLDCSSFMFLSYMRKKAHMRLSLVQEVENPLDPPQWFAKHATWTKVNRAVKKQRAKARRFWGCPSEIMFPPLGECVIVIQSLRTGSSPLGADLFDGKPEVCWAFDEVKQPFVSYFVRDGFDVNAKMALLPCTLVLSSV